jgi:hypothetical protein
MDSNDPNKDWIDDVEKPETDPNEKYERFYYKWKRRVAIGENPDTASRDAPEGFTEWLKSNKRGIK